MPIVVIIDTFNTHLDRASFAEVFNHLVRMFWARDAFKVSEQQWHCFFTVYEIEDFLIFPTLLSRTLNNRLIVIWAFGQSFIFKHLLDASLAKGAATLM